MRLLAQQERLLVAGASSASREDAGNAVAVSALSEPGGNRHLSLSLSDL